MHNAAKAHTSYSPLLMRTADNAAFYTALTRAEGMHEISDKAAFGGESPYRLIRVDGRFEKADDDEFEIALIDDAESSVAYYDKVTVVHLPEISSRRIAHSRIWRSASYRHSLALRDILQKVLFGYLVQEYDVLISQGPASWESEFYWYRKVSCAVEAGLYVYVQDLATEELRPIPTQSALNEIQDRSWSGTDEGSLRAFISVFPLR